MSAYQFKLPDIGEGTAEAEIVAWHVKVGDKVKEDQPLVDMMTEKATVELTSPVEGIVRSLSGDVGNKAAVGSILVILETAGGAAAPAAAPAAVAPKPAAVPAPAARVFAPVTDRTPAVPGSRPAAAPSVRRRAGEMGIQLEDVPGTGPSGRITQDDLDAYVASGRKDLPKNAPAAFGMPRMGVQEIPIIGLRRKIAEQMQLSKRHIPHFTYVEELDMTALDALRAHLNATKKAGQPKLTVLPFFMLTMVKALQDFPQINSLYDDEANVLRRYDGVHIGMATQTDKGLMVPVVRHAEARDIWDIAAEIARLAVAARDGKAKREELSGSTITLTSLGTLGGIMATPVINRPEVGIVCPNKIIESPIVKDGQIVVRKIMNLSAAFDHRIVDGVDGASFVQRLKAMLEHPATIFMS